MRKDKGARKAAKKKRSTLLVPAIFLGVMTAVLVGMLILPSPDSGKLSGVELFGEEPDAAIYGPELPQSTVGNYPVPYVKPVVLPEATDSGDEEIYVYASDDQKCYHLPTCKFAFASGHRFTVAEARLLGYKPCGRCDPPLQ